MAVGVLTRYSVNGNSYSSYVLGDNLTIIEEIVTKRNLGEVIESSLTVINPIQDYTLLSDSEFETRMPEILHTACFLSFIAMKSGMATIDEVLGDDGVLHEVCHWIANIEGCNKKSLSCVRDLVNRLQKKAVGL